MQAIAHRLVPFAFGALLLCGSGPAFAAPVGPSKNAKANIDIQSPMTIENPADLDFATLSVRTAGTARIDPNTDTMSTTGGVTYLTGTPHRAHYRLTTGRLALVFITLPSTPITMRRQGGTETMTVSNWTIDGNSTIRLTLGTVNFYVGGTLNVAANQKEGLYTGTFLVSADYF